MASTPQHHVPAPVRRLVAHESGDPLLTTSEVAKLFRVARLTVVRWCDEEKLACVRTPGGQRRVRRSAVDALMRQKDTR
jgi:excisionase family DNA binding protein